MSNDELCLTDARLNVRASKTAKNAPVPMMSATSVREMIASIFSIIRVVFISSSSEFSPFSIPPLDRKRNRLD